ncbi:MAG: hypothetical protein KJO43_12780, partial [Phycisphaerae bacterium]|nr:hypothetical protein [Phycisphaerae bacterium]
DDDDDDETVVEPRGQNLGVAFDEQAPIEDRIYRDPFTLRPLERFGIYLRELDIDELLATVDGRQMYDDSEAGRAASPAGYEVATNRLRRDTIEGMIDRCEQLFLSETVDPATGELRVEDQTPHLRAALEVAWDHYAGATESELTIVGFSDYLRTSADAMLANEYVQGLRQVLVELRSSGLSEREVRHCTAALLDPIAPRNIPRDDFEQLVRWSNEELRDATVRVAVEPVDTRPETPAVVNRGVLATRPHGVLAAFLGSMSWEPATIRTACGRGCLQRGSAPVVIERFQSVLGYDDNVADPAGYLQGMLDVAWINFTEATGACTTEDFMHYLRSTPSEHGAYVCIEGLRDFFVALRAAGLTCEDCTQAVLAPIAPADLGIDRLARLVEAAGASSRG